MDIKAKQEEVFYILQDVKLGGLSEREGIKELDSIGVMLVDKEAELPRVLVVASCAQAVRDAKEAIQNSGFFKAYPLEER